MLYRNRSQSLSYKQRRFIQNSGIMLKPQHRLNFPIKQQITEGYVGRKQFNQKNHDQVILGSDNNLNMYRRDKMDVSDIYGAKPVLNIQSIKNKSRLIAPKKSNSQSSLHPYSQPKRRLVTDSLDELITKKNQIQRPISKRRLRTLQIDNHQQPGNTQKQLDKRQIQKYLLNRNNQLTKQHILGIYSDHSKLKNPEIKKSINQKQQSAFNPTFMSYLKLY